MFSNRYQWLSYEIDGRFSLLSRECGIILIFSALVRSHNAELA